MSAPLRTLTAAERVDAFGGRGIMLYAVGESLRARCAPEAALLLDAARPMLALHRSAIVAHLRALAAHRAGTQAESLEESLEESHEESHGGASCAA